MESVIMVFIKRDKSLKMERASEDIGLYQVSSGKAYEGLSK